jgi:hypothetical protein
MLGHAAAASSSGPAIPFVLPRGNYRLRVSTNDALALPIEICVAYTDGTASAAFQDWIGLLAAENTELPWDKTVFIDGNTKAPMNSVQTNLVGAVIVEVRKDFAIPKRRKEYLVTGNAIDLTGSEDEDDESASSLQSEDKKRVSGPSADEDAESVYEDAVASGPEADGVDNVSAETSPKPQGQKRAHGDENMNDDLASASDEDYSPETKRSKNMDNGEGPSFF